MTGMGSDKVIMVQGFMCNELKLSGNELLVFAIIYGFSQDGMTRFRGGRSYISKTLNISMPTVDKALKSLIEKELIVKVDVSSNNGCSYYEYYADLQVVKKLYTPYKETSQGEGKETLQEGSQETLHRNTNTRNIENRNIGMNIVEGKKAKFVKPTVEEIQNYIDEKFYTINAQYFFNYYEANGWYAGKNKMKDWKRTLDNWQIRENNKPTVNTQYSNGKPKNYNCFADPNF